MMGFGFNRVERVERVERQACAWRTEQRGVGDVVKHSLTISAQGANHFGKKGFTLVELVVVLMVIAIVTHLAVREASRLRDSKLEQVANKQLDVIRAAVFERDAAGEMSGFLCDMGRMVKPSVTNGLEELLVRPSGAKEFGVRQASAANLVAGAKGLADANVWVPTGWRGPYVKVPFGKDVIRDPWGNKFVEADEAGFERVVVTNGFVVGVAHYGAAARREARQFCSVVPNGGSMSRLIVQGVAVGTNEYGTISFTWYGPAEGMITGAVESVEYPTACVFEGLTPGVRILKDSVTGVARQICVRPGDNLVEVVLP